MCIFDQLSPSLSHRILLVVPEIVFVPGTGLLCVRLPD